MDADALLAKCEQLLELLYANNDQAKLRLLTADIEELRDRLLAGEQPEVLPWQAPRELG